MNMPSLKLVPATSSRKEPNLCFIFYSSMIRSMSVEPSEVVVRYIVYKNGSGVFKDL